jgi:hypothetical protein
MLLAIRLLILAMHDVLIRMYSWYTAAIILFEHIALNT